MPENHLQFTLSHHCSHCDNNVQMQIVASHSCVRNNEDYVEAGVSAIRRIVYELLSCMACDGVSLRILSYRGESMDCEEIEFKPLNVDSHDNRFGSPVSIRRRRSSKDVKAWTVMLGRLAIIHECNKSKSA